MVWRIVTLCWVVVVVAAAVVVALAVHGVIGAKTGAAIVTAVYLAFGAIALSRARNARGVDVKVDAHGQR